LNNSEIIKKRERYSHRKKIRYQIRKSEWNSEKFSKIQITIETEENREKFFLNYDHYKEMEKINEIQIHSIYDGSKHV
jgi:hypothetical protein